MLYLQRVKLQTDEKCRRENTLESYSMMVVPLWWWSGVIFISLFILNQMVHVVKLLLGVNRYWSFRLFAEGFQSGNYIKNKQTNKGAVDLNSENCCEIAHAWFKLTIIRQTH